MSDIIINTNNKETTTAKEMEAVMLASGDTEKMEEIASETITETAPDAVEATEEDINAVDINTTISEEAVGEDEMIYDESSGVIEEGMDTGMGFDEGMGMGFDEGRDMGFEEGMYSDSMSETGVVEVKDPILSSWPFVIGISAAVLCVSVILGILLARRKIKKGIELYED